MGIAMLCCLWERDIYIGIVAFFILLFAFIPGLSFEFTMVIESSVERRPARGG